MRFVASLIIVGFTIMLALAVKPIHGQEIQISRQPAVIASQLRQAAKLGRSALRGIETLSIDDSIPIDSQVYENARQAYYLIRAARYGLEAAISRETYQDPMIHLAYQRVEQAWHLSRTPVDGRNLPRAEYRNVSLRDLTRALQLIDQALVILP